MERRRLPRFKAWISCSVSVNDAGKAAGTKKILGHTHDLNRDAIAIILPSNQTYGVDPQSIGSSARITLALPNGYLTMPCSLLRHEPRGTEGNLVVFSIDQKNEQYQQHLADLAEVVEPE
jgi:hypothetical protein